MARMQAPPSLESAAADGAAVSDPDSATVAAAVRQILGRDLTAVVAGAASADVLARQSGGDRPLSPEIAGRMCAAHEIVELLLEVETPAVVQAWFNGMNPMLGDRSPAAAIGDDPALVLRAARAFRAYG